MKHIVLRRTPLDSQMRIAHQRYCIFYLYIHLDTFPGNCWQRILICIPHTSLSVVSTVNNSVSMFHLMDTYYHIRQDRNICHQYTWYFYILVYKSRPLCRINHPCILGNTFQNKLPHSNLCRTQCRDTGSHKLYSFGGNLLCNLFLSCKKGNKMSRKNRFYTEGMCRFLADIPRTYIHQSMVLNT